MLSLTQAGAMVTWERYQAQHAARSHRMHPDESESTSRAAPGCRRCIGWLEDHFAEFSTVYDDRFARQYGYWRPVITEVVEKYLAYRRSCTPTEICLGTAPSEQRILPRHTRHREFESTLG